MTLDQIAYKAVVCYKYARVDCIIHPLNPKLWHVHKVTELDGKPCVVVKLPIEISGKIPYNRRRV